MKVELVIVKNKVAVFFVLFNKTLVYCFFSNDHFVVLRLISEEDEDVDHCAYLALTCLLNIYEHPQSPHPKGW